MRSGYGEWVLYGSWYRSSGGKGGEFGRMGVGERYVVGMRSGRGMQIFVGRSAGGEGGEVRGWEWVGS